MVEFPTVQIFFFLKKTRLVCPPPPVVPHLCEGLLKRPEDPLCVHARGMLNSPRRKDQVKFECLLFVVLKVRATFGFPEARSRLRHVLCSCFSSLSSLYAGGVKRLLGSESLSHTRRGSCQDDGGANINTSLARCWFPSALVTRSLSSSLKLLIHLWLLRCGEGVESAFYFLRRPLPVRRASRLRPSSPSEPPKSFWRSAESKDLEKSGGRSCVFISVSPSNKH